MNFLKILLILVSLFCPQFVIFNSTIKAEIQDNNPITRQSIIKKKLERAKELLQATDVEKIQTAQRLIDDVLRLEPGNAEALRLSSGVVEYKSNPMNFEDIDYYKACNAGTRSALEAFLAQYPSSGHRQDAMQRIEDAEHWQNAKNTNTIESYEDYLQNSTIHAYMREANAARYNLVELSEWEQCKDSNNPELLQRFIKKHPCSAFSDEASYLYNIACGDYFFEKKRYDDALNYYAAADSIRQLPQHYIVRVEQTKRAAIRKSNSPEQLKEYLASLTKDDVDYLSLSNRLAIILSQKLDASSTEYDYEEALSYACDDETKKFVKKEIKRARKEFKEWQ